MAKKGQAATSQKIIRRKAEVKSSGKNLNPHSFNPSVNTFLEKPKIFISPLAFQKMEAYIRLCSTEISWLGTVSQKGTDYLIEDVFLPEQENSGTTTDITEEGLSNLSTELLSKKNGVELCNKLRFWGHSHVRMNTEPSFQDEQQLKTFMDNLGEDNPFFIRSIGNKNGRMQFSIFLHGGLISFEDIAWEIYINRKKSLENQIENEIEEKVTEVRNYFVSKKSNNSIDSQYGYWEDGVWHSNDGGFWKDGAWCPEEKGVV